MKNTQLQGMKPNKHIQNMHFHHPQTSEIKGILLSVTWSRQSRMNTVAYWASSLWERDQDHLDSFTAQIISDDQGVYVF